MFTTTPDRWELLEEPTAQSLVHYTDSEGFEDWFDLNNDNDLMTYSQACADNSRNGITWKIELCEVKD